MPKLTEAEIISKAWLSLEPIFITLVTPEMLAEAEEHGLIVPENTVQVFQNYALLFADLIDKQEAALLLEQWQDMLPNWHQKLSTYLDALNQLPKNPETLKLKVLISATLSKINTYHTPEAGSTTEDDFPWLLVFIFVMLCILSTAACYELYVQHGIAHF